MYFPPDFKRRLLKFADKINLFGNFSFGPGCLEIRCSKSYHLCDLALEDIFDNEVFKYVQLFSVRPQMKNRTRNTGVLFHNSHYFRFRIARFNLKLHFFFFKYVFLAVCCCCRSIGVYVFLAALQVSRCNDLRSGLWENRLERRDCSSGGKPLFYFRLVSNR